MNTNIFLKDCDREWPCAQTCAFCSGLVIAEAEKHVKGVHRTRFCSDECYAEYRIRWSGDDP